MIESVGNDSIAANLPADALTARVGWRGSCLHEGALRSQPCNLACLAAALAAATFERGLCGGAVLLVLLLARSRDFGAVAAAEED